ncbi:hypothetical protein AYO44_06490 [Planctomycetaceae bacterium SCGC AG-212-F19]|nr:hypothetical protein AYO44_06490 [Planctomycetaceae bacterium SCGC AG-212-F19]
MAAVTSGVVAEVSKGVPILVVALAKYKSLADASFAHRMHNWTTRAILPSVIRMFQPGPRF